MELFAAVVGRGKGSGHNSSGNQTTERGEPMKKWNTPRIAFYAAFFGAAYNAPLLVGHWGSSVEEILSAIGQMGGGAVGGAMLASAASGIRNTAIRKAERDFG